MLWQLVGPPRPTPGVRQGIERRPTELRSASLRALQAISRIDAHLTCVYCAPGAGYEIPTAGCPCRATRSPGLRRTSVADEYTEMRGQLLSGAIKLEYRPAKILSIR